MVRCPDEGRERREKLLRVALAESVRRRIAQQRLHQTDVARSSGISRTFLQSILRAEKGCSLFVFLELSQGLGADPCNVLSEMLSRHELLRPSPRPPPPPASAPMPYFREQVPITEVTVNNVTFRIGETVRIGRYTGELIHIDSEHLVTVDIGEDFDDGYNDGFAHVAAMHLIKINK